MLRPNGNFRKIRDSDRVSLSNCSINAQKAWRSQRDVFALHDGCARFAYSSGQKQSNLKNILSRCRSGSSAVLDAVSCEESMHDSSPAPNITSAFGRSWRNGQCMDKAQEITGAGWIKTLRYLAATGTTARTPVRAARSGTSPLRSRGSAFGSRFVCDDTSLSLFQRYGLAGRPVKVWSASFVLPREIHSTVRHNA